MLLLASSHLSLCSPVLLLAVLGCGNAQKLSGEEVGEKLLHVPPDCHQGAWAERPDAQRVSKAKVTHWLREGTL